MAYRYLDDPVIMSDGTVLRFPYVEFVRERGISIGGRLFKRRRRCRVCGHRHGPSRNLPAKRCEAHPSTLLGPPCSCTAMLDWSHPSGVKVQW